MSDIDVVDSTWIDARPAVVGAAIASPAAWRRWWPELELAVTEHRGEIGMRWTVLRGPARTRGSMEIWLEHVAGEVVLHYFLRLDRRDGRPLGRRRRLRLDRRCHQRAKRVFWALADQLDPARTARLSVPR